MYKNTHVIQVTQILLGQNVYEYKGNLYIWYVNFYHFFLRTVFTGLFLIIFFEFHSQCKTYLCLN